MSRTANRVQSREDFLIHILPHVLIAMMLAVAALLLAGFLSLLDDMNQRGEQRRLQQRTTGSLLLADELRVPDVANVRVLTAASDGEGMR